MSSIDRRKFIGNSAAIVGVSSLAGAAGVQASVVGASSAQTGKLTRAGFEGRLISRAWQDPRFARSLLSNPRDVIARELNVRIPNDVTIRVLQEDDKTVYFVLPPSPYRFISRELTPEDIGILASGTVKTACAIPSTVMMPAWFHSLSFDAERLLKQRA